MRADRGNLRKRDQNPSVSCVAFQGSAFVLVIERGRISAVSPASFHIMADCCLKQSRYQSAIRSERVSQKPDRLLARYDMNLPAPEGFFGPPS